jgi:DNA-binding response OmpR family regulator
MSQSESPLPTTTRRILVVEDEPEIQILVNRILRSVGHEVESAGDGAEAITKVQARRPDLIVLDIVMPRVDGWAVLDYLREVPNPPPVILLTGRTDYETFARGVRAGASAYVVKPFRFHEFVATCQRVLLAASEAGSQVMHERRRYPRRFLIVEVNVLSHDDKPIAMGELLELSAGGARLEIGLAMEIGERIRIAFHIPGGVPLHLAAEVRWNRPSSLGHIHGLEFVDLAPADVEQLGTLLGARIETSPDR